MGFEQILASLTTAPARRVRIQLQPRNAEDEERPM